MEGKHNVPSISTIRSRVNQILIQLDMHKANLEQDLSKVQTDSQEEDFITPLISDIENAIDYLESASFELHHAIKFKESITEALASK